MPRRFAAVRLGDWLRSTWSVTLSMGGDFGAPEALASGVPAAAFPVTGPKDIITDPRVGGISRHLPSHLPRGKCA
jgi:hypothetical protein